MATRTPLPVDLVASAGIEGIPLARIWGDEMPPYYQSWVSKSQSELESSFSGIMNTEHTYLALSGGGPRGAYGAGVIVGWTEAGTRPEFTVVTGVSVGALTAPFAFLGPDYDDILEKLYTEHFTSDLVKKRNLFITAIWRDSIVSTDPLKEIIADFIDEKMVKNLAAEYKKGRRLYVITTNLDASRPVMWNIGAIAASESVKALGLIHDVILASASIPGLMPPVYIEVEANGEYYDEMHVDGGTSTQVMFYPTGVDIRLIDKKLRVEGRPTIYVIRNGRFNSPYEPVKPKLLPIAIRSVDSLLLAQGKGDLSRIYFSTRRDDIDYRLTFIPSDFDVVPEEVGGLEYMKQLFTLGRRLGKDGTAWREAPPDVVGIP
ncbi:patatin-like phospholipase family protein [Thermodesulfobacteriota bacterium]